MKTKFLNGAFAATLLVFENCNLALCILILLVSMPAAIFNGIFLENWFVFATFGIMFLIEMVAGASFAPDDKFFDKPLVQIFMAISRLIWLAFSWLLFSEALAENSRFGQILATFAVLLLIGNAAGIVYRTLLVFPNVRRHLISTNQKLKRQTTPEAPQ